MHLFGGPVDVDAHVAAAEESRSIGGSQSGGLAQLRERVDQLESEVAELKEKLGIE